MFMKNYLIILSILLFSFANGQIFVVANTSVSGQKFQLEVDENETLIFLKIKIFDSISTNKKFEKQMEKIRTKMLKFKKIDLKDEKQMKLLTKAKNLDEANSYYSEYNTQILKTQYPNFSETISLIKNKSKEELEKDMRSGSWITIDGTSVEIVVKGGNIDKEIWVHSPGKDSHPIINDLLQTSIKIFRTQNILPKGKRTVY